MKTFALTLNLIQIFAEKQTLEGTFNFIYIKIVKN